MKKYEIEAEQILPFNERNYVFDDRKREYRTFNVMVPDEESAREVWKEAADNGHRNVIGFRLNKITEVKEFTPTTRTK